MKYHCHRESRLPTARRDGSDWRAFGPCSTGDSCVSRRFWIGRITAVEEDRDLVIKCLRHKTSDDAFNPVRAQWVSSDLDTASDKTAGHLQARDCLAGVLSLEKRVYGLPNVAPAIAGCRR